MERVIDCPCCFDKDACFEDIQDTFSSYMCFNCGFMSNSVYTDDNLNQIENSSKLVNDLKLFDEERKIYWQLIPYWKYSDELNILKTLTRRLCTL